MKLLSLLVFPFLLSGCFYIPFTKSDLSGVPKGEVAIWLPQQITRDKEGKISEAINIPEEIAVFLRENTEARQQWKKCLPPLEPDTGRGPKKMGGAPAAVPIVTALGKLAFDSIMDAQERAVEDLKERSIQTYTTVSYQNSEGIKNWSCLGVVRLTKDFPNKGDQRLGMLALFDLIHVNVDGKETAGRQTIHTGMRDTDGTIAIRLRPLFVRAFDAVAFTKKKQGSEDKPEAVNLAYALALKALEHEPGKQPRIVTIGAGVLNVSNVNLGQLEGDKNPCKNDTCESTGLIPLPQSNGPMELSVSVTETGNVGFNIDVAKAKRKAFKDAIGPAIETVLKDELSDE